MQIQNAKMVYIFQALEKGEKKILFLYTRILYVINCELNVTLVNCIYTTAGCCITLGKMFFVVRNGKVYG